MNAKVNSNLIIRLSLALALAVAIWSPAQVLAAEPDGGKVTTEAQMMEQCKQMMAQKQKMADDMKAQDAELTDQLTKMNNAPDDKKLNLMASIITRLVEQRTAMNARKDKMEAEMIKHMMQHMQMGKESMAKCPMMAGMTGMDGKAAEAPKEHHEVQK